ncbi:MAG: porin [Lysobacteraceae bacterium]
MAEKLSTALIFKVLVQCCLILMLFGVDASSNTAMAGKPSASINVQYDLIRMDSGEYDVDRDRLRRARLAFKWKSDQVKGLALKAEYDFASSNWTDVYASLDRGHGRWRVGQFKQPFGMETLTSDKDWLFMESPVAGAFGVDRRLGVGYDLEQGNWHGYVSAFGDQIKRGNSGNGVAARLNWTPLGQGINLLHLGIAGARENPADESFRLRLRPEVSVGDLRFIDSGSVAGIDNLQRGAMELAWRHGPLLLQGEHLRLDTNGAIDDDLHAEATQLSLGWLLTGEIRPYKEGLFGSPTPSHRRGAVELALRWSRTASRRDDISQVMRSTGLGVNWYLRQHVRLMLDAHRASTSRFGGDTNADVVQARIQIAF